MLHKLIYLIHYLYYFLVLRFQKSLSILQINYKLKRNSQNLLILNKFYNLRRIFLKELLSYWKISNLNNILAHQIISINYQLITKKYRLNHFRTTIIYLKIFLNSAIIMSSSLIRILFVYFYHWKLSFS